MAEKEYIERDAVLMLCQDYIDSHEDGSWRWVNAVTDKDIMNIPSADVVPVRHGRWKKGKGYERPTENGFVHDDRYFCDCCGWGCCCETKLDFNFCPNCGAKNGRGG